jgi:hypothetical protein
MKNTLPARCGGAHACNPTTPTSEAKAGGPRVPWGSNEFKDSLSYIARSCLLFYLRGKKGVGGGRSGSSSRVFAQQAP